MLIKNEQLLCWMVERPEFIKDIMNTISDLIIETFKVLYEDGIHFDGLWVNHDMGYKNSSLFSPETYKNVIAPSDLKRNKYMHSLGVQTIVHSDGCVKNLIPYMIESGFDCLQPIETKAGMDLIDLKHKYKSKIALFGGIDVTVLETNNFDLIEKEIKSKINTAKIGGGYIYHSDHSISNKIELDTYKFVLDCVLKYGIY